MIKNSFKTVFKHPKILIGFAIPYILLIIIYYPMIQNQSTNLFDPTYAITMLFLIVAGIFMQFLFFPVFYNYIYELSSGRDEKGWIKRGLKRNWWKIFVITLISYIPFYIMYAIGFAILMFFIFSNPSNYLLPTIIILGLICIFAIFWFAFFYIAQISVVAEERFQDGMKNIFKVGFKNYFKVLLASIITGVPAFAIGFFGGINAFYDNYKLSGFWATTNDLLNNPIVLVISLILALALGCVAISFMYVYTNKLYIAKRQELMEKQQETIDA